jgi:hypothetical protein
VEAAGVIAAGYREEVGLFTAVAGGGDPGQEQGS